jgi:hypothetical protein
MGERRCRSSTTTTRPARYGQAASQPVLLSRVAGHQKTLAPSPSASKSTSSSLPSRPRRYAVVAASIDHSSSRRFLTAREVLQRKGLEVPNGTVLTSAASNASATRSQYRPRPPVQEWRPICCLPRSVIQRATAAASESDDSSSHRTSRVGDCRTASNSARSASRLAASRVATHGHSGGRPEQRGVRTRDELAKVRQSLAEADRL